MDRSLVMRALGGAITSPCSDDSESRRPPPTIFGLSPHLLSTLDAIGLANTDIGTLWETVDRILSSYLACTVATSLNNMHAVLFC